MIFIGLGSNLTSKQYPTSIAVVKAAIEAIEVSGIKIAACSNFYETEPVPKSDQPWFINAVAQIETTLSADQLLKTLHKIEEQLGRTRRDRWEARIIDIDLLCYDDVVVPERETWLLQSKNLENNEMVIPHSRMHERDFVLIPFKELAPGWVHPVLSKSVVELLEEQESAGIVRQIPQKSANLAT